MAISRWLVTALIEVELLVPLVSKRLIPKVIEL